MKIKIQRISKSEEEVASLCIHDMNHRIEKAIHLLTTAGKSVLLCKKDDAIYKIPTNEILYLEAVNRKVFVYTQKDTLEVSDRLYVLEEQLSVVGFVRISKSMVVNIDISNSCPFCHCPSL